MLHEHLPHLVAVLTDDRAAPEKEKKRSQNVKRNETKKEKKRTFSFWRVLILSFVSSAICQKLSSKQNRFFELIAMTLSTVKKWSLSSFSVVPCFSCLNCISFHKQCTKSRIGQFYDLDSPLQMQSILPDSSLLFALSELAPGICVLCLYLSFHLLFVWFCFSAFQLLRMKFVCFLLASLLFSLLFIWSFPIVRFVCHILARLVDSTSLLLWIFSMFYVLLRSRKELSSRLNGPRWVTILQHSTRAELASDSCLTRTSWCFWPTRDAHVLVCTLLNPSLSPFVPLFSRSLFSSLSLVLSGRRCSDWSSLFSFCVLPFLSFSSFPASFLRVWRYSDWSIALLHFSVICSSSLTPPFFTFFLSVLLFLFLVLSILLSVSFVCSSGWCSTQSIVSFFYPSRDGRVEWCLHHPQHQVSTCLLQHRSVFLLTSLPSIST